MTNKLLLYLILTVNYISYSQITIEDKETMEPVSFATISFGNGNGLFADEDGKFIFTKERYKDIDTLVITSIGYNELKISTGNLAPVLKLSPSNDQLTEVFIQTKPKGKFKTVNIKPVLHDDYFKCWLPTIESEIAVYFPNDSKNIKQISKLFLPIKAEASDWKKRKKANAKKRNFSTLCKVNFYENNNGYPGEIINYEHIVFRVTQETEAVYELNLEKKNILIPENGIYASIQILGYTNKDGNLLPNKKYQEIKTKKGIVKVSTTFRPLLPFTDKIKNKRTFVKRIFLNDNKWISFDRKNITKNKLLISGLNNYGMGMEIKVYQEKK